MSIHACTVRGLHFQRAPFEQAKLLRVLRGRSFHVPLDVRLGSPTFKQWCSAELSDGDPRQLFAGSGFAHGMMTLAPGAVTTYTIYCPATESGFAWDDREIGIKWPASSDTVILSEKDAALPPFALLFAK